MVFKLILSGRNSHQLITDNGFHYTMSRKPHGPNLMAYYNCVVRSCPARAATAGSLDDENIQLKYHNLPNKKTHTWTWSSFKPSKRIAVWLSKCRTSEPRTRCQGNLRRSFSAKGEDGAQISQEFLQKLGPFSKHQNMIYCIRRKVRSRGICVSAMAKNVILHILYFNIFSNLFLNVTQFQ